MMPSVPDRWGAERQKLEGHDGRVNAVDFSPDGKSIVFHQYEYIPEGTTSENRIIVMPVETGGLPERVLAVGSDEYLRGPVFSPAGDQVAWTASVHGRSQTGQRSSSCSASARAATRLR